MGGKYEGCRESQRMPEPAESERNEAARAALVCKLYNGRNLSIFRVACHGLVHEFGEISSCEAGPEDAGSQPSAVRSSAFLASKPLQIHLAGWLCRGGGG